MEKGMGAMVRVPARYKTFPGRLGALIIDTLVFLPFLVVYGFLIYGKVPELWDMFFQVVLAVGFYVYSVCMHAVYGQTLGKMITKVKVLDESRRMVPSWWQALLRDSVEMLFLLVGLWFSIGAMFAASVEEKMEVDEMAGWVHFASNGWVLLSVVVMVRSGRRRTVHDLIAGTVVVNLPEKG